jgi:hypothetical protein
MAQKTDHITLGDGMRLQCMHCGVTYTPALPVAINVVVAMGKAFTKTHRGCKKPKEERCGACLELGHGLFDHVRLKVLTAEQWPGCGDDGTSSTAIWRHMRGVPQQPSADAPHDPSDFGRCHRLLAASWAAGWRSRMPELATLPSWRGIAPAWEELDALFVAELPEGTGSAPRLYARLQELRGGR